MKRTETAPRRCYMLCKPQGYVCACRDEKDPTVLELLPPALRDGLFPLGRLDKYTEGLILLTDDGKLNRRLLDPEHHVQKQYLFWAAGTLSDAACAQLRQGVRLKGLPEPTRPARLELLATSELGRLSVPLFPARRALAQAQPALPAVCGRLWMTEGKRHQVKRMLEAVGCTAVYLKREAFGPLLLDDTLTPGQFRPLTEAEFSQLRQAAGLDNTP